MRLYRPESGDMEGGGFRGAVTWPHQLLLAPRHLPSCAIYTPSRAEGSSSRRQVRTHRNWSGLRVLPSDPLTRTLASFPNSACPNCTFSYLHASDVALGRLAGLGMPSLLGVVLRNRMRTWEWPADCDAK